MSINKEEVTCPFCGSPIMVAYQDVNESSNGADGWAIGCTEEMLPDGFELCIASFPGQFMFESESEALAYFSMKPVP